MTRQLCSALACLSVLALSGCGGADVPTGMWVSVNNAPGCAPLLTISRNSIEAGGRESPARFRDRNEQAVEVIDPDSGDVVLILRRVGSELYVDGSPHGGRGCRYRPA
ncbi:hypothetical protein FKB34_08340 [Glycocaulis profundi]|nr:hypothetical protein FKB34_08340 [Glycocaulis profundi]